MNKELWWLKGCCSSFFILFLLNKTSREADCEYLPDYSSYKLYEQDGQKSAYLLISFELYK